MTNVQLWKVPVAVNVRQLPTLGGTAIEPRVTPLPPIPPGAWGIFAVGVLVTIIAGRRSRPATPRTARPNTFRRQPMEA